MNQILLFAVLCLCRINFAISSVTPRIEYPRCSDGVCGNGRCGETETGIECFCPLNSTGTNCEYTEQYKSENFAFSGGSYAAYDKLTETKNIKFQILPESDKEGVILYAAESYEASNDFIAVILKDKHIEFSYVAGEKMLPVVIRSINPAKVNEWMSISVGRPSDGPGYLKVDSDPQINETISTGRAETLNLKTNLYIGGYDKRIELNGGVGVVKGFEGCFAKLEIAGKCVDMISDLLDSANVRNCGHQSMTPVDADNDEHPRCDSKEDVCLTKKPCEPEII